DGVVRPEAPDSGVQSMRPQDAAAAAGAGANGARAVRVDQTPSRFSALGGGCC
ncbi:hypothetical protein GGI05_005691, partial [Coemansia sp. RSA 2603]